MAPVSCAADSMRASYSLSHLVMSLGYEYSICKVALECAVVWRSFSFGTVCDKFKTHRYKFVDKNSDENGVN